MKDIQIGDKVKVLLHTPLGIQEKDAEVIKTNITTPHGDIRYCVYVKCGNTSLLDISQLLLRVAELRDQQNLLSSKLAEIHNESPDRYTVKDMTVCEIEIEENKHCRIVFKWTDYTGRQEVYYADTGVFQNYENNYFLATPQYYQFFF